MVARLSTTLMLLFACTAVQAASAAEVTVTAIHATKTESAAPTFDESSRTFQSLLDRLEFDSFTTVKETEVELKSDGDTDILINERYTLRLGPAESQPDGHIKCRVEVFGQPRNATDPVKVLEMTVRLAPNKPVMIRGLRMDQGELIAILERE